MIEKSETRNQKSERRTKGHLRYFAGLLPEVSDDRDMAHKSEAQTGSGTRRSRRFIRLKFLRILRILR
jgi:hypothetical protein